MRIFLFLFFILFTSYNIFEKDIIANSKKAPPFLENNSLWVDSILQSLTLEEKIGQLFMVAAYSNKDEKHFEKIKNLINEYNIGGLMFLQGGPLRQARLTNKYQKISKVPLMIAQDAEWGLSMRIDSVFRFPWQMTLGAVQDIELIYKMGYEIGKQCNRLGVHINFAPVVDVNSNPKNPIIGNRSFGQDPNKVAKHSIAYMKGLQDAEVLACAKHFPGHGDTDTDSHKTLPTLNHSRLRLDSVDLIPFKEMIDSGLGSIMVAHLNIPELDNSENSSSSLSKNVVTNLLKKEMGFKGITFTDALNMKGVSDYNIPGEVDVKALLAGNDVLLFSEDVPKAISKIKEAILKNEITQSEIDERCRKILLAKKWFGLDEYKEIKEVNLVGDINSLESIQIKNDLIERSLTLLQNNEGILPLKRLDTLKIACLSIGSNYKTFQSTLLKYASVDSFNISENHNISERKKILKKLSEYNLVIVSVHKSNINPWKKHHISKETDLFLQTLAMQSKIILTIFSNPYSLSDLLMTYAFDGLLLAYQNSNKAQSFAAQAIFGGISLSGRLPVTNNHFKVGHGISTNSLRIKYTTPIDLNLNHEILYKVDSIAIDAISKGAMPGCQIIALKNGKVFYQKNFGFQTYKKQNQIDDDDVYDIASITKIAAAAPSIMYLYDKNLLSLDDQLKDFINFSDSSNKKNLFIKDILTHQARLKSWIPFFKKTLNKDGFLNNNLYSNNFSKTHSIKVAEDIFLINEYADSIFIIVDESELLENKKYKYSDLGYYLLNPILNKLLNTKFDKFLMNNFYSPLGLTTMGFHPKERFKKNQIVPTEFDYYFRSQLLRGDVHDMGSAMLGGVSSHAGLFSNANDLAILMQMYLQNGEYGGDRYLNSKTLKTFTSCQFCNENNRRGLIFDKPALENEEGGPACDCNPSSSSFGHSGFTGTLAWVDPSENFVYVFLSNRVHPTSENNKLLEMDVRTKIMDVFYKSIRQ